MAGHDWARAVFQARTRAGFTKRSLAKSLGIDASYVTHIEAGKKVPSVGLLEDIAMACKMSLVDLVVIASVGCVTRS